MIDEGGKTYCIDPLETVLTTLSKRWALLVIGVLGNHPGMRFGEARRTIPGISARALSNVLDALQEERLVRRNVDTDASPPAVSYDLTPSGWALRGALIPLIEWASERP